MSSSRWGAAFPQTSAPTPPQPQQHGAGALPIQVPPEKTIGAFRPSIARPPVPQYIPQPIPAQFGRPPKGPSVAPVPRPVPVPVQASSPAPPPSPLPSAFPSPVAAPPHQQPPPLGRGPTQAPNQQTKRPAAQRPPPPPPQAKRRKNHSYPNFDLTRLPEMPVYLTTMPDICKGVSNEPPVNPPSEYTHSMKLLPLSAIEHVDLWTTQVEEMAKSCGCYRELTTRFGVFPKPGTVEAFVCQTRYRACWNILHETISGPVWSYMRALGYSKIPVFKGPDGTQWQPAPVDAFYYARQAGHRLMVPGTPTQSRMEIMLMVEELRMGQEQDYPSPSAFTKGHLWMKGVLDRLIRQGDRQVCESLYDQKPDWTPGPDTPGPAELRWNLGGYPLQANPHQAQRDLHAVVARKNKQVRDRQEEQLRVAQQGVQVQNGQYSVISAPARPPSPPPPLRRSRMPAQSQNQQPFPVPHFHQMQQQSAPNGASSPQLQRGQQQQLIGQGSQLQQSPQGPPHQQQLQPPQPAPAQQTEVITIADSPTPPLFSEEGEEDDDGDDEEDEREETFHDAEEGGDVDVDGGAEDGYANEIVMTNVNQTNSITNEVEETEESGGSEVSEEESEED